MPESKCNKDGGSYTQAPPGYSEALGRATYKAKRIGTLLAIEASGTLGYANQIADIRQSPNKINPQQFDFYVYTWKEISSPVVRDFSFVETFAYPVTAQSIVIFDANGAHEVAIQPTTDPQALFEIASNLVASSPTFVGHGATLQEAFDNAVAHLPRSHPADAFVVYDLIKTGAYRGGFVGLIQCFAVVSARFTDTPPS